jgi:hypothetical protein
MGIIQIAMKNKSSLALIFISVFEMKKFILINTILFIAFSAFSQNTILSKGGFLIGLEAGIKKSMVNAISNHNTIIGEPTINHLGGIVLGYNLLNNFVIESGMIIHSYKNSYSIIEEEGIAKALTYKGGTGFTQIPLRVKKYIPIFKNIKLHSFIGASLIHHAAEGLYLTDNLLIVTYIDGVLTSWSLIEFNANRTSKSNLLMEGGIGLSTLLAKKYLVSINATYLTGWKDFNELTVQYTKDKIVIDHGIIFDRGNSWNFTVDFKFPLMLF